jgi:hypothetical protein
MLATLVADLLVLDGGNLVTRQSARRWNGCVKSVCADTSYFEPSQAPFMVNYRVAELQHCWPRCAGCNVVDKI